MHDGDGITFEKIANVLDTALKDYFPEDIRIIAEPGRYYAAPAYTIATQIIARRLVLRNENDQGAEETDFVGSEQTLTGDEQTLTEDEKTLTEDEKTLAEDEQIFMCE